MTDKHDEAPDTESASARISAAHPMGVAVGATGAAAAGAAIGGGIAGPVGAVVGAAVGAVAGGLGGKAAAESVNPSMEDAWWKEHYAARHYVRPGDTYETYRPAYEYGWQARMMHTDTTWSEIEPNLAAGWAQVRGDSKLEWSEAQHAAKDAWERVGPPIGASRTEH
jgi:phage tail tape-measure protein